MHGLYEDYIYFSLVNSTKSLVKYNRLSYEIPVAWIMCRVILSLNISTSLKINAQFVFGRCLSNPGCPSTNHTFK